MKSEIPKIGNKKVYFLSIIIYLPGLVAGYICVHSINEISELYNVENNLSYDKMIKY